MSATNGGDPLVAATSTATPNARFPIASREMDLVDLDMVPPQNP
jgi:hypothetical protein